MKVYITSDLHFFDRNAIRLNDRPYDDSFEGMVQNAVDMFNNINQIVKKDDLIIFLGDVAFINSKNKKLFKEMFKQLHGNKILVKGNHDKKTDEYYLNSGFLAVTDFIHIGRYFLCHYPLDKCYSSHEKHLLEICKHFKCDTIIHGHVHDEDIIDEHFTRINVSVDHNQMQPLIFHQRIFKTFNNNFLKNLYLPTSADIEINHKPNNRMFTKHFKEQVTIIRNMFRFAS